MSIAVVWLSFWFMWFWMIDWGVLNVRVFLVPDSSCNGAFILPLM